MPKAEAMICYLLGKRAPGSLCKTALMKLCYFADLENVRRFGRPITDMRWRRDNYGAVAYEILDTARQIPEIRVDDRLTHTGDQGADFRLTEAIDCGPDLSMNEKAVLDDIWEQYGSLTAKDLGALTKRTEPWAAAEQAETRELDLSVVGPAPGEEFAHFARVLERVDLSIQGEPEEIAALEDAADSFMAPYRMEAMRGD